MALDEGEDVQEDMQDWVVKGKFLFHDDMVTKDEYGMLCYEFTIESDFEPDTEDIRRTIGLHAIHLLPESTNGRLTRVSPNDD